MGAVAYIWVRNSGIELPNRFIRPVVFDGHKDPTYPYGRWSLVCQRRFGTLFDVEFMMPSAPSELLEIPDAFFDVFNGPHRFATGMITHDHEAESNKWTELEMAAASLSTEDRLDLLFDFKRQVDEYAETKANTDLAFKGSALGMYLARHDLPVEPIRPRHLYFHVGCTWREYDDEGDPLEEPTKDDVTVTMSPRSFFDKLGHNADAYLGIVHLLPPRIIEEGRGIFWTKGWTIESLRAELLKRGFVESEAYSAFAESHDPFCG